MNSSLYYDICAVVLISTLILALIVRKLIKGRTNMLFLIFCVSILLTTFFDIITEYYDNIDNLTEYYTMLRLAGDYGYFLFRSLSVPLFVTYICSVMGLWHVITGKNALRYLITIPIIISTALILINPFTHIMFYIDDTLTYQAGSLMMILYAIACYYTLLGMIIVVQYRMLLSKGRTFMLFAFMPINIIAAIIQLKIPVLRIELFITAAMSIAIAISVQRPEEMMDSVVDAQSYNAFLINVKNNFRADHPVTYLLIKFVNFRTLRNSLGLENYLYLLKNLSGKIERIARAMNVRSELFYLDSGSFAFVAEESEYEKLVDIARTICAYMMEPIKLRQMEVMLDSRTCIVNCPSDISKESSFLNFASTFETKIPQERRVICFSEIAQSKEFRMRNDIDTIINRGIANYNFQMYYQPIYSTTKKKFVSAEALIRLFDDDYGFVSPALFIPAAEESGAIHEIGDFVIEDVCRFVGSNDFEALGLEYIELNLSVAQCVENDLYEKIDKYMKMYGVRPEQINLEITETSVDYDPETTDRNIRKLSDAGLTFSLDDYGTGYSNITRVVSLPLNIVKLDKTLVDEMDTPMMWIVIKNTVDMLKHMNKKILVEGIEDQRSLDRFVELGCDYIQGFYFSKPLPESKYIEFVLEKNFGIKM